VPEVQLSAGTIEYEDTGGDGPILVFSHGLVMDGSLWRNVVAELRGDYRCVLPVLPLGSHRRAMRTNADLSMRGQALLLAEFLERLECKDVTLVVSDWGGPLLLAGEGRAERIGRLVICSCEAFDNVPPGLPGRMIGLAGLLPGGLYVALQQLRLRSFRGLPIAFGWMIKGPLPHDLLDRWFRPSQTTRAVRRDLGKYVRSARQGRRDLRAASERLADFGRPTLVVWAAEDRVMPPEHGRRLAELLPAARLVEIADSYTLIPVDQPIALAHTMREFLEDTAAVASEAEARTA
jgi:pimeloyl-ACP methyl ester carboxylesterase